jgi:MoxR-like ATPase
MANNQSPIYIAIFKKPTQAVLNAAEQITGVTTESKHLATLALETAINQGKVSVDRVGMTIDQYSMAQVTKPITGGALTNAAPWAAITESIDSPPNDSWVKHLGRTNEQVKSIADSLSAARSDLDNKVNNMGHVLTKKLSNLDTDLRNDMAVIQGSVKAVIQAANNKPPVDAQEVARAVAREVAGAFAPFKQAVADAQAQAVVAQTVSAIVIESKPVREVFGIEINDAKGNPLMADLWNAQDAPAIDPNFVWTEKILRHLLLAQRTGENLWFGGHKGTGKSETARQFAAYTGRSFTRINFHKFTTTEDYVGAIGLDNGETVFKQGDFLRAFTSPSTVVLLDEVTNADAGELATLNGFLEPNSAVTYGGAVRRRAPGVLVFAADNTLGSGDESGRYAGTRTMNSSLVDRFARVIHFDYLPLAQEVDAVMRHTGCSKQLAEHILASIRMARAKVETGDVVDAPSIRSVIAFIRALDVLSIDDAWATTVAARQPSESAAALEAIRKATLNPALIQSLI